MFNGAPFFHLVCFSVVFVFHFSLVALRTLFHANYDDLLALNLCFDSQRGSKV